MISEELLEEQELMRAKFIIQKAIRDNEDVVDTLVQYFVSKSIIKQLTGQEPDFTRKTKAGKGRALSEWVSANVGKQFTTAELAESMGVSSSVALKATKNLDYFVRVKRGLYLVRDGISEREEAKAEKNT